MVFERFYNCRFVLLCVKHVKFRCKDAVWDLSNAERERAMAKLKCHVLFDMHSNSWSIYLHETGVVRH